MTSKRQPAGPRKAEDGTWWFIRSLPSGPDDKRRQARRRGFATRREAQAAFDKLGHDVDAGTHVALSKLTTGEWLAQWLDGRRASIRPGTWDRYAALLRQHVLDQIGHVPVQRLTANDLDRCYATALATGLSPRTVRFAHTIVRKALADAVRKKVVTTNVADFADPPAHSACKPPEMSTWSPEELRAFLAFTADHDHAVLFRVAAMTGLRRGELGALRWRDVDLDAGVLTVRRGQVKVAGEWTFAEPKTSASRRTIDVDPATVASLREQRRVILERRMALGTGWTDADLVFPNVTGGPADIDGWTKAFLAAVRASGLPRIRLHDLRHAHASHLLASTDVRTVAARLGHADPGMTLRVYSHVMPGRQAAAAAAVAALVDGVTTL